MTPDLSNELTITLSTAAVGAVLIALSTAAIIIAWRRPILDFLYRHGILIQPQPVPQPFPLHYVLPYQGSGTTVDQPLVANSVQEVQRRSYPTPPSDESLPSREEPRNATPGPSNAPRTPSPAPAANDRDIRARYEQFPPPPYDPTDVPTPERAMAPLRSRPLEHNAPFPTQPWQRIFIRPPAPFPDESSSSEDDIPRDVEINEPHPLQRLEAPKESSPSAATTTTTTSLSSETTHPPQTLLVDQHDQEETMTPSIHMAPTTSGPSSPPSTDSSSVPKESRPGSSNEPTLRGDTLSPLEADQIWTSTLPPTEEHRYPDLGPTQRSRLGSLLTETKRYDEQIQDEGYVAPTGNEQYRSSATYRLGMCTISVLRWIRTVNTDTGPYREHLQRHKIRPYSYGWNTVIEGVIGGNVMPSKYSSSSTNGPYTDNGTDTVWT
ncbi:hypothetical protein ARMSODRAFT_1021413 [Armillaria solidipes]|uniref:Uncharacterized protein n=1 Tax=Armillaria solidipes TaxID=1076256 RepID=A0A2H3B6W8_9AGAR|nr:hypothetical protein ARMSODRAFT_1021413 [Armillaria solidipes]